MLMRIMHELMLDYVLGKFWGGGMEYKGLTVCGAHSQLTSIFNRWRLLDKQFIQLILQSFYVVITIKLHCN